MVLTSKQISHLLNAVATVTDDPIDCDGCFARLSEFAESELAGQSIPAALSAVETHLKNCPCCQDEYQTLLAALRECEQL